MFDPFLAHLFSQVLSTFQWIIRTVRVSVRLLSLRSLVKIMYALAILSFIALPVFAVEEGETTAETDVETELSEIVVTATRYEEEVKNIPAHVTVITEEDIKNSPAQNVPELLRTVSGVKVNDINGNRRTYTVDLRGFGETAGLNTLVLVDGRRINQPDLSGADWVQIPLDRIERIEIIRGGRGSVLYGDNATGGVINIITREGDRFEAGAVVSAGSYDTYRTDASVSGREGDLSFALSGSYLHSDGYRDNADTEAKDVGLNLNYYFGDMVRFNFSTGYHKDDTDQPGAIKQSDFASGVSRTDSLNPDDFSDVEDYYFKARPEIHFGNDSSFKIDASFRKRDSLFFFSFDTPSGPGTFTGVTEIETLAVSPQFVFKNEFGFIKNRLTLGFDYEDVDQDIDNESSSSITPGRKGFDLNKKNQGYYIHDEISPLEGISLSAGYRYDRADFDFDPVVPASADDDITIDEDAYTAGINYTFHKKSYAYLSYSRSFRYPVLDEFFNFFGNTIDTTLKPQRSDDYELGVRHYFVPDSYAQLNFFMIDTADEIFFNPTGGPNKFGANENLDGRARRQGMEVSFSVKTLEWLTVNGSYTYTDAEIQSGDYKDKHIPDVPEHQATLETILVWKRLTFALNGIYVGERPFISDFASDFDDQDDYLVLNAKIAYSWKMLTAFLDINNLADKGYSEYGVISGALEEAFYPSPKRNFLFGISAAL